MFSEAAVEAISGAVGSVLAVGVTYPLTTVSTWQALDHKNEDKDSAAAELQRRFSNVPSPIKELILSYHTKGCAALFAGLRPCLAATAISQGVYFYLYSALRQAFANYQLGISKVQNGSDVRRIDIGVLGSTIVASLAGCGNVMVTIPVWVVANQMIGLQKHPDPAMRKLSSVEVARHLYKDHGVYGFWKGLVPSLIMVLNPTLQYIMYEWLTARLLDLRRSAAATMKAGKAKIRLAASDVFMLTALAKMGSTLITYPLLLIKNRLQAMNKATDTGAQYSGVADAVLRILQAEGFRGFFKGIQMKLVQTVLAASMLMSIKEQLHETMKLVVMG